MYCAEKLSGSHVYFRLPLSSSCHAASGSSLRCLLDRRQQEVQIVSCLPHGRISRSTSASRYGVRPTREGIGRVSIVCRAGKGKGGAERTPEQISADARIRSEVIAPFRSLRLFLYLAFMASAGLGSLIALTRVIGAFGGAPNADPLPETLKGLGIDIGALVTFALLYRSDKNAQDKSIARITREENLSRLRIELANKRVVTLGQLRGTCRLLIVAGPKEHIEETFRQADPFKNDLVERGVLMVPVYTDGSQPSSSSVFSLPSEAASGEVAEKSEEQGNEKVGSATAVPDVDKRFVAAPIYTNEWAKWLGEQKQLANVQEDKPVYISLRIDGRVRASGLGFPPLRIIAAQLPPLRGMWAGALDGLDGRV